MGKCIPNMLLIFDHDPQPRHRGKHVRHPLEFLVTSNGRPEDYFTYIYHTTNQKLLMTIQLLFVSLLLSFSLVCCCLVVVVWLCFGCCCLVVCFVCVRMMLFFSFFLSFFFFFFFFWSLVFFLLQIFQNCKQNCLLNFIF